LFRSEVIARQALLMQTQHLPKDFYQNYIQHINAVTVDQIHAAAQKYFSYDNARILVVGKASDVLPALEKLPYPIHYYDRFGNPTTKPEVNKMDANVTVNSVLDDYIQAVGGDKTQSVKTIIAIYEGEVQGMKLNIKSINSTDKKSLELVTMMGNPLSKSVFNGKTGYREQQGQREEMTSDEIQDSQYDALPFPELELANKPGVTISGIENCFVNDAYVWVDGKQNSYYELDSGLKLRTSASINAGGQTINQFTVYGEYKEFDGIKVPSQIILNMGMDMEFNLTDVKIN